MIVLMCYYCVSICNALWFLKYVISITLIAGNLCYFIGDCDEANDVNAEFLLALHMISDAILVIFVTVIIILQITTDIVNTEF